MNRAKFLIISTLTVWCAACGGVSDPPGNDPTIDMVDQDTVFFDALRKVEGGYHLAPGDVFDVEFLFERTLNTRVKVRPDGFVALPVVGEVPAAGQTPARLDSLLTTAYSTYYREPEITVNVLEFAPLDVFVLGEVRHNRSVPWHQGQTMLQVLAEAGGHLVSGNLKSVILLRRIDTKRAYARRVNLHSFLHGDVNSFDFFMQPYDVIYVPKTFIARVNQFVDQFFRQMYWVPQFYLRGWEAFHVEDVYGRVAIRSATGAP